MAIDEKTIDRAVSYVLPNIEAHRKQQQGENGPTRPFVLALSGLQGSGKSTWATALAQRLNEHHHLKTIIVSLDDLYHTHEELVRVRESNPQNTLFRNRGQPGTHDEVLAERFFKDLGSGRELPLPRFDKSRFNGEGDRVPESEWEVVPPNPPVNVLIFEGWCVGFQALPSDNLESKWNAARELNTSSAQEEKLSTTVLGTHPLKHIKLLNDNLKRYNETFMGPSRFSYLIHLNTDQLVNVYKWRIEQEEALRAAKGTGQTDDQVVAFVRVYMPAYELYLERLQNEAFVPKSSASGLNTQLRIQLDIDRSILAMEEL
ncbi:P-loop containing nucleoside triphosphate hydrolase protein [Xylariaceae sp. FL0255]|nr:P-loop containing nucleoside triphosphate hydrolase protein [Xylariaceae sp. FL0255]